MFKKKKGFSDMLVCILVLLFMFIVLRYSLSIYQSMNNGLKKEALARSYMLSMESRGYLTPEDKQALLDDLTELGVTDIDFTGTTLAPVGYGQPVILSVTGRIDVEHITGISSVLNFIQGDAYDFKMYTESTAKY